MTNNETNGNVSETDDEINIYEASTLSYKELYSDGIIGHFEYCGLENESWKRYEERVR